MINKEEILLNKRILITRLIESTDYRISISKKRKKKKHETIVIESLR